MTHTVIIQIDKGKALIDPQYTYKHTYTQTDTNTQTLSTVLLKAGEAQPNLTRAEGP